MTDAPALNLAALEAKFTARGDGIHDDAPAFQFPEAGALIAEVWALRRALHRLRVAQHRMDDAWLDGDNTARALAQLELQSADEAAAAVWGGLS